MIPVDFEAQQGKPFWSRLHMASGCRWFCNQMIFFCVVPVLNHLQHRQTSDVPWTLHIVQWLIGFKQKLTPNFSDGFTQVLNLLYLMFDHSLIMVDVWSLLIQKWTGTTCVKACPRVSSWMPSCMACGPWFRRKCKHSSNVAGLNPRKFLGKTWGKDKRIYNNIENSLFHI